MTEDEVATKTLVLQVFDWDLITGDDDIGEVLIILKWSFQFFAVQVRIPSVNFHFHFNFLFRWEYPWQMSTFKMGQTNG